MHEYFKNPAVFITYININLQTCASDRLLSSRMGFVTYYIRFSVFSLVYIVFVYSRVIGKSSKIPGIVE